MNDRLVLNDFKRAYRGLGKYLPKPLRFVLLGYMVWLENKFIEAKAKAAINKAISDYEDTELDQIDQLEGVHVDDLHVRARYKSSEYSNKNL